MKLVILMYLRDDEACVEKLLADSGIPVYSRLEMEGVSTGAAASAGAVASWYGESIPYSSEMIFTFVPDEIAGTLLRAVAGCEGVQDPRHPIRALQLPVERATSCQCE